MTPQELAARLANVAPGDWQRALDINHAYKMRQLNAGKLFRGEPPDFRSQLIELPPMELPLTERTKP